MAPQWNVTKVAMLVAVATVPPITVVTMTGRTARATLARAHQPAIELIEAPDTWIPFQADLTVSHSGQSPIRGRFYRSSQGSRRIESGPDLNDIRVISIANIPDRTGYVFNAIDNHWRSFPLAREEHGVPRFRKNMANWILHPRRLAVRVGESGAVNADIGLVAYRVFDAENTVTLKVPDLNFFSVVSMRLDGRYERYTNVDIGTEPNSLLFSPPTGVLVVPDNLPSLRNHSDVPNGRDLIR